MCQECRLILGKSSEMIVLGSLLATSQVSNIWGLSKNGLKPKTKPRCQVKLSKSAIHSVQKVNYTSKQLYLFICEIWYLWRKNVIYLIFFFPSTTHATATHHTKTTTTTTTTATYLARTNPNSSGTLRTHWQTCSRLLRVMHIWKWRYQRLWFFFVYFLVVHLSI